MAMMKMWDIEIIKRCEKFGMLSVGYVENPQKDLQIGPPVPARPAYV